MAVLGGDGQIAGGHELAAGGGGGAFHGGDHRFGAVHDGAHQLGALVHQQLGEGAAAIGIGAMRGELLEVVAGAERGAPGGDHDRAHGCSLRGRVDGALQRFDHGLRQAVARLGTGKRQHQNACALLALEQGRARVCCICLAAGRRGHLIATAEAARACRSTS